MNDEIYFIFSSVGLLISSSLTSPFIKHADGVRADFAAPSPVALELCLPTRARNECLIYLLLVGLLISGSILTIAIH